MKAYILSDKDYQTDTYVRLLAQVKAALSGFDIEERQIGRGDIHYCVGCFGCWVKKPGECVLGDDIANINRAMMNSDVVVYLNPVVFGQFSANMKYAIDRWLPNMLPFFETRKDGSTMHPRRYESYPKQIMIGYGEDLSADDAQLFIDITQKHRNHVDVLIDDGTQNKIKNAIEAISPKRIVGGVL
jgi:multimeric flavodoxin WrbA